MAMRARIDTHEGSDPRAAARDARLRYVSDDERGYGRRRRGRGFSYLDGAGETIGDPDARARNEALVIPPAWEDVWICRHARGHRVGNSAYAKSNGSYGLTTLRAEHVDAKGDEIDLKFDGKGGAPREVSVRDEEFAAVVRECQEIEGQELFRYLDGAGAIRTVDSCDVNDYLREASGSDVTAKDFRTWAGTVLSARELSGGAEAGTLTARKRVVVAAMREVAAELGNPPAVCRRAYVHPRLLEEYLVGTFADAYASALDAAPRARPRELRLHEAATLRYLDEAVTSPAASSDT